MSENANDRFERLAEEFPKETGFTAPGKDVSAEMGSDNYDERVRAWRAWRVAGARQWECPTPEGTTKAQPNRNGPNEEGASSGDETPATPNREA